jgi:predicted adenine nucleotide alpha hydrolase (AANH) superfamily ATPase
MSKAQDLEDMQEFVNEYENIKDTLESLLDEIDNKELKEEVNGLLSVLEEDYEQQNKDFTERIAEMENEEENYLERQYCSMRL